MKSLFFYLFGLILFTSAYSQQWNLFNANFKYNYALNNNGNIYKTIFVDSIGVENNDSIYYLNKTILPCPTCGYCNYYFNIIYLSNQPQFFLSKFKKDSIVSSFIYNNKTYSIMLNTNINDSWVFDSLNNVDAQTIEIISQNNFGNSDSIRIIQLSNSDTIILSKNYGIMKFPLFDSSHQHVNLIGIEGPDIGVLTPKYENFFVYNINDSLEYYYVSNSQNYSTGKRSRIVIINKLTQPPGKIKYITKVTDRTSTYIYGNITFTYTTRFDSLVYSESSHGFLRNYASQPFILNNCHKVMEIGNDTTFECNTKFYSSPEIHVCLLDTLYQGPIPPSPSFQKSEIYGENIGLIESDLYQNGFSNPNIGYVDSKYKLIACNINHQIFGTFTSDFYGSIGINDNNINNRDFQLYPNPIKNELNIRNSGISDKFTFVVYNINGQVLTKSESVEELTTIDLSYLYSGIYFLKIFTDKTIKVFKIAKD